MRYFFLLLFSCNNIPYIEKVTKLELEKFYKENNTIHLRELKSIEDNVNEIKSGNTKILNKLSRDIINNKIENVKEFDNKKNLRSYLIYACYIGNQYICKEILSRMQSSELSSNGRIGLIHILVYKKDNIDERRKILNLLINKNENLLEEKDVVGHTACMIAAISDNIELFKLIYKEVQLKENTDPGMNIISYAAMYNSKEILKYLFTEKKISLDYKDAKGRTCLNIAVESDNKSIEELYKELNGTALIEVLKMQNVEMAAELIEKTTENGLKRADIFNQLALLRDENIINLIINKLYNKEVNKYTTYSKKLEIFLKNSMEFNKDKLINYLWFKEACEKNYKEVVELLFDKDFENEKDYTKLISSASFNGHIEIVKFLLSNSNNTELDVIALAQAADNGHIEIVKFLLNNGVNINEEYYYARERKALPKACCKGHTEIVKLLLEDGADVEDDYCDAGCGGVSMSSNLSRAISYGHIEIVKLLLDNGANVNKWFLDKASREGYKEIEKLISIFLEEKEKEERIIKRYKEDECGDTPLITAIIDGSTEIVKSLLDKSVDFNNKRSDGSTALIHASSNSYIEIVKLLLDKGANVNDKDEYGNTSLIYAANNEEIVKLLLDKGANVNDKNKDGNTALIYAANNKEVVKLLLDKGANVNDKNNEGDTPLILASRAGDVEIVKLLLNKDANVHIRNKCLNTALIHASSNGYIEIVKLLLDKGASVHKRNKNLSTALMEASKTGDTEIVKLLLDEGANVHIRNKRFNTALIHASSNGYIEIVKLLLDKGANVNDKNNNGWTALMWASQSGNEEIVDLLLSKGANVNDKNNKGYTALYIASQEGHKEVAHLLITKGANVNDKDEYGWTALIIASQEGHKEVADLLITRGANINDKNNDGDTPLISASYKGHVEAVKLLLNKGANVNDKNNEGCTPLIWASRTGNVEIVELLLNKGANVNDKNNKGYTALDSYNWYIKTYKIDEQNIENENFISFIDRNNHISKMLIDKLNLEQIISMFKSTSRMNVIKGLINSNKFCKESRYKLIDTIDYMQNYDGIVHEISTNNKYHFSDSNIIISKLLNRIPNNLIIYEKYRTATAIYLENATKYYNNFYIKEQDSFIKIQAMLFLPLILPESKTSNMKLKYMNYQKALLGCMSRYAIYYEDSNYAQLIGFTKGTERFGGSQNLFINNDIFLEICKYF